MSPFAISLVAIAAVTHATWNLAAKRAEGGTVFLALCSLCSLTLYAVPVAFVLARHGLALDARTLGCIAGSAVIHWAYFNVLQRGYRAADLSVVYPVARGTGPLLSVALSIGLLGERPSALALGGAAVVIAGVFFLAGGEQLLSGADAKARAGAVWGLTTGLFIAGYTVLDGYAVRVLLLSPIVLDYASHVLRVVLSLRALLRDRAATRAEWKRTWRYALTVGSLGPLGYILVLIAMRHATVSSVAPARELSMLVGAFLGARVLREGQLTRRVLCAALIALGVLLIVLG